MPQRTPTSGIAHIDDLIPDFIRERSVQIPDVTRSSGVRIVGARGSGKSRLVGRLLTYQDFLRGVPQVIIDPVGGTADNFLDKVGRIELPEHQLRKLWRRITWIDMGGSGGLETPVVSFPLLFKAHNESCFEQSQRYTDTVLRFDPYLQTASMQGWNAFYPLASAAGTLLAAMGGQLTEASHMVNHPDLWEPRIRDLAAANPFGLQGVADFLLEDIAKAGRDKQSLVSSFLTKMRVLDWNPHSRALFGGSVDPLDWDAITSNRQTVILDFRNETNLAQRRFKLLWVFGRIMEYITSRAPDPRQLPFGVVIDEIRYLLGDPTQASTAIQGDLEELINQQIRNKTIWLTIMHQELNQLHPSIRQTLMTMSVQAFGGTSDPDAALSVAKRFHNWDPGMVKKTEPMYGSESYTDFSSDPYLFPHGEHKNRHIVLDERTTEYSIEEQEYLHSRKQLKLPQFTYLVGVAKDEGSQPIGLKPMSIEFLDTGQYVNQRVVSRMRNSFMRRDGTPVGDVLAAIARRLPTQSAATPPSIPASTGSELVRRAPKRRE